MSTSPSSGTPVVDSWKVGPPQELGSGTPLSAKYGRLGGFTNRNMIAPPSGLIGLVMGFPGKGKSAFFQSNPDAFIFNLDESSTTTPNPPATIWPGIGPTGSSIETDGSPVFLSWPLIAAKITILKDMARANEKRPRTIVFDCMGSLIRLIQAWMPAQAGQLNIADGPRAEWKDLNGKAAWDILYNMIVNLTTDLHSHGYGVYHVVHLMNAKIPLGDDKYVIRPEMSITDNFYKRLFGNFELVGCIDRKRTSVTEPDPRFPGLKKTVTREVDQYTLSVNDEALSELLKFRVRLPEPIVLPLVGGWSVFEAEYLRQAALQLK